MAKTEIKFIKALVDQEYPKGRSSWASRLEAYRRYKKLAAKNPYPIPAEDYSYYMRQPKNAWWWFMVSGGKLVGSRKAMMWHYNLPFPRDYAAFIAKRLYSGKMGNHPIIKRYISEKVVDRIQSKVEKILGCRGLKSAYDMMNPGCSNNRYGISVEGNYCPVVDYIKPYFMNTCRFCGSDKGIVEFNFFTRFGKEIEQDVMSRFYLEEKWDLKRARQSRYLKITNDICINGQCEDMQKWIQSPQYSIYYSIAKKYGISLGRKRYLISSFGDIDTKEIMANYLDFVSRVKIAEGNDTQKIKSTA